MIVDLLNKEQRELWILFVLKLKKLIKKGSTLEVIRDSVESEVSEIGILEYNQIHFKQEISYILDNKTGRYVSAEYWEFN